ncbi:UNVERIFIED_CONTAM: hypothetical protein K2H54_002304 [Gekko kuhli]
MAAQVEVGPAHPPLTARSELPSEAKPQRPFASSLSGASNKPGELHSSFSSLILEEGSKSGNPLRSATMPPASSRPRLTPKPFSRDKSSETFSVVKPPVPSFKSSNVAPNLPAFARTFEETTVAKGLTGNVPPLVDQKSIEDKSPSDLVANMPFDSSPQANTVILFESGKSEKGRMKFTPERSHLGSPQICGTLQAPEGHLAPSKSEVFGRTGGIHRQLSLSSESRPISWNPCTSLEKKDNLTSASEEKGKVIQRQYSAGGIPASEVQLRPKQRPVSAVFLESLKDQKQCCFEASEETSLPEKTWVRKPRPLSMDLTAKFENRELSLQRKSCPTESKEKDLSADATRQGSVRPSERWTKNEAGALSRADPSKSSLKSPGPFADFASFLNPKPFPSEEGSPCQSSQKDFSHATARDRKCLWESKLKRHDEQNASEMETETTPEKVTEPSSVKGQSVKDRAALSPKEPCAARKNSMYGLDTENQSLRDVEKPINVPDSSANDTTSGNVESQPGSPREEGRILNIQQRIKELTAENTEAKSGSLRQSFRSRPLSADLTKLFSSPVRASEPKPEKLAELNRKPANKAQESQEMKANPPLGTDSGEGLAGGVPWRPQQPVKILHMQRDGSFARERHSGPAAVADHDAHASSTFPAERACVKTVRATMFEHHVQRHKVADDRLGAEPPLQPTNEVSGSCRESWTGKATESKMSSKEAPRKPLDTSVEANKPGRANSLNKERVLQDTTWKKYTSVEKCENPAPKHMGDALACQRIEPRYEILQTVGKRAQSEAVSIVCEDKAVTLRSRRSLKERRKPGDSFVDASWSRSLDLKCDGWKEDGFVSGMKETTAEVSLQALSASLGQHGFNERIAELDNSRIGQKHVTAKASCSTSRNKDVAATDRRVSTVSPELEKEKSKGKAEGSKGPKRSPEDFGAGLGRVDGGGTGASVSQSAASGSPSEPERRLLGSGGRQWPTVNNRAPHHSADMRTPEQEESEVFGFRKYPSAHREQEALDAARPGPEGHPFQHFETEELVKRSGRRASAERWRRKTLPHDIRFEDAGGPPAGEGAKVLIRRDSLQLHEGSMAKKSRKPRCVAEPQEGTSASPGSPEDRFADQPSPSKPKATYFAVTYQIPNEVEGSSGKEFAHKSRWFSSLVENTSFASHVGAPGRSHPSSDGQFCSAVSDLPGSLDRHFGRSWEEAGGGDALALLTKGALRYPASERREESWRSLERQVEDAKDRIPGIDPPFHSVAASSPGEQNLPLYSRHFRQGGDHSGQKQHSDYSYGISKEKTADSYRSRVLDIDALMAEYREDSQKPSAVWDRRDGEESSSLPWEKRRRSSSDKTSFSYSRKDPRAPDGSPGSPRRDVCSTETRRPENGGVSEREGLGSREPSSVQHGDGKFSPPPWGRPPAPDSPADVASAKKKTFLLDEEPGASLTRWSQGANYGERKVQLPDPPLYWDWKAEAGFAPHPSLVLADSILQKGTCPKQRARDAPPEGDGRNARRSSAAGSPRQGGSSAGRIQEEWDASALAVTSPDLKHLYSGKAHLAKAKDSLPAGTEPGERRDQHRFRQSFPPQQVDDVRPSRRSASQQRSLFREEKKDPEEERSRPDPESLGARTPPHLASQRKSRSFYRARRVDHWATVGSCFDRSLLTRWVHLDDTL